MNWKKCLAIFLALCLFLSLAACGGKKKDVAPTGGSSQKEDKVFPQVGEDDSVEHPESATPVLYQITDGQGNRAWLLGTIHIGLDYYYPLPEYVTSAYESADALAVEADIVAYPNDTQAQTQSIRQLIYTDGSTIKDHIPEQLYSQMVAIVESDEEYSAYVPYFERFVPYGWYDLLNSLLNENVGLD